MDLIFNFDTSDQALGPGYGRQYILGKKTRIGKNLKMISLFLRRRHNFNQVLNQSLF
jgi:hypothetical protein